MNGQNVVNLRSPDYRNDCEIEKESVFRSVGS